MSPGISFFGRRQNLNGTQHLKDGMNHRREENLSAWQTLEVSLNGFARRRRRKNGNVLPAAISRLVLELVDV